jgi:hypothetical protein
LAAAASILLTASLILLAASSILGASSRFNVSFLSSLLLSSYFFTVSSSHLTIC